MGRHTKIGIAIIVALLIALGIVWEAVPYVRYLLIPVTGGTEAPKSLTDLPGDTLKQPYSRVLAQRAHAGYRQQILPGALSGHTEESP